MLDKTPDTTELVVIQKRQYEIRGHGLKSWKCNCQSKFEVCLWCHNRHDNGMKYSQFHSERIKANLEWCRFLWCDNTPNKGLLGSWLYRGRARILSLDDFQSSYTFENFPAELFWILDVVAKLWPLPDLTGCTIAYPDSYLALLLDSGHR